MAEKKYYWLKLKENFFNEKEIKKLRRVAGGDTLTIIYLKMLLLSLRDDGKLYFEGIEDTFADELALTLDEDVDNVKLTISYLISVGLMEEVNPVEAKLTRLPEMLGMEGASAERMRRLRDRQKLLEGTGSQQSLPEDTTNNSSQCDNDVTGCDTEIEIEKEKKKDKKEKKKKEKIPQAQLEREFDELWKLYPNKKGKTDALKHYIKARNDGTTYEEVEAGIKAYVKYIHTVSSDKYIKYGSSFFCQKSWIDDWSVNEPKEEVIDDGLDILFGGM